MLQINDRIAIPEDELEFDYARSGGPGGQNVNKVSTKAVMTWRPAQSEALPPAVKARFLELVASRLTTEGVLIITSQLTRDRLRNVEDCRDKLRALVLQVATPPKIRRPSKPTRASQVRRVEEKRRRSEVKRGRKFEGE